MEIGEILKEIITGMAAGALIGGTTAAVCELIKYCL